MPVEWTIEQLDCYPEHEGRTDVVCQAHWRATARVGEVEASAYGTVGFDFDPAAKFQPFEKLAKRTVLGWVKAGLGSDLVADIEKRVSAELAEKTTPTVVSKSLPWADA